MYPAGFDYMAPPPPYPGPPKNWAAPSQNGMAAAPAPPGRFLPHFPSAPLPPLRPSASVHPSHPIRLVSHWITLNHATKKRREGCRRLIGCTSKPLRINNPPPHTPNPVHSRFIFSHVTDFSWKLSHMRRVLSSVKMSRRVWVTCLPRAAPQSGGWVFFLSWGFPDLSVVVLQMTNTDSLASLLPTTSGAGASVPKYVQRATPVWLQPFSFFFFFFFHRQRQGSRGSWHCVLQSQQSTQHLHAHGKDLYGLLSQINSPSKNNKGMGCSGGQNYLDTWWHENKHLFFFWCLCPVVYRAYWLWRPLICLISILMKIYNPIYVFWYFSPPL